MNVLLWYFHLILMLFIKVISIFDYYNKISYLIFGGLFFLPSLARTLGPKRLSLCLWLKKVVFNLIYCLISPLLVLHLVSVSIVLLVFFGQLCNMSSVGCRVMFLFFYGRCLKGSLSSTALGYPTLWGQEDIFKIYNRFYCSSHYQLSSPSP